MAKVREGPKTVLMVVDVQTGAMAGAWDAARVIAHAARAGAAPHGCIRATAEEADFTAP